MYRIRVTFVSQTIPEAPELERLIPTTPEEETVEVLADSLEEAIKRAPLFTKINARGRLVRYFDERGNEIFGSHKPKSDVVQESLWELHVGDRLHTIDGDLVEVVAPTQDGEWVKVRYVDSRLEGMEDLLHVDEVAERL